MNETHLCVHHVAFRAINYDERDPFMCTSCGFCKYGKFDFTLSAHPCTAVEPVNNEEERKKAFEAANSSLEQADKCFFQLAGHRQTLEGLLRTADLEETVSDHVSHVCLLSLIHHF